MIHGNSVIYDAGALRRHTAKTPFASIRRPRDTDGAQIWSLIKSVPSLDDNSLYCNLLQATHFAGTCAVAEQEGQVVGWTSGYIPPEQPDTLFIWQVCVNAAARGQGFGRRLIADVLSRPKCGQVTTLQCTITHDNEASWALFTSISRRLKAQMSEVEQFGRDEHLGGEHDSEYGVSIAPFDRNDISELTRVE